jgi:hypothetical protein
MYRTDPSVMSDDLRRQNEEDDQPMREIKRRIEAAEKKAEKKGKTVVQLLGDEVEYKLRMRKKADIRTVASKRTFTTKQKIETHDEAVVNGVVYRFVLFPFTPSLPSTR